MPGFVTETLTDQPQPPRHIPFASVTFAVLAGADCAIYVGSAVVFIAVGLLFMTGGLGFTRAPLSVSLIFVGVGFLPLLLALFRIWQVRRAVRDGDAQLAEVVEAEAGRARYRGTPWGEPLLQQGVPIAAKGTYRLGTGETGSYYMQQSWALPLRPGDRIWVVRLDGRDVLYAPGPGYATRSSRVVG